MPVGVISFGKERPVFGSSASFITGLIDTAIGLYGRKDYLLHLHYKMEWGYGHIEMEELHVDEIREFASAIAPYRAHYLALPDLHPETRESVEQLTDELTTAMQIYVAMRVAAGALAVERDFWTLRSAEDAARRLREPLADIPDPDAFTLALAERTHHTLHTMMLSPDILGGAPLAQRLSELGRHIGGFPDTLEHPEATFRLIEDGMDGENEALSEALLRHLVPAMVEASVKAGTWEALRRHLGQETRKWALEHYEFEFAAPEQFPIFSSELQRIKDLTRAAKAGDWAAFKALSDEPYINEEGMKSQFDEAVPAIRRLSPCRITEASAVRVRGNRMIHAMIGEEADKDRITVMMVNLGNREGGPFHLWIFGPTPDFS